MTSLLSVYVYGDVVNGFLLWHNGCSFRDFMIVFCAGDRELFHLMTLDLLNGSAKLFANLIMGGLPP